MAQPQNPTALVTVAIPTRPFPPVFEWDGDGPDSSSLWEGLPRAELSVRSDESLGEVLSRACTALGLRVGAEALEIERRFAEDQGREPKSPAPVEWLRFVGFRRPDDDEPAVLEDGSSDVRVLRRSQRIDCTSVVVRDSSGHAVWKRPPFEATMGELFDAHESKLLQGNPREIYLIPLVPQGDAGLLGDWAALVVTLKTLWDVAAAADRVAGVWAFGHLIKEVLRRRARAREVIEKHATSWADRGAAPQDLTDMLAAQPRSTEEIAALLGCSADEAAAVMWGLGFGTRPVDNLWVRAADQVGSHIAADVDLGANHLLAEDEEPETLQSIAERRLRELGEKGEAPSLDEEAKVLRSRMLKRMGVE